jgi:hypothetical protein
MVPEDPHGVTVVYSLPACRIRLETTVPVPQHPLAQTPESEKSHAEPLQVLLEKVTDNLKTLDLEDCEIRDPRLTALLPSLSHCSQLTTFSFFENHISMSVLKDLLHHTVMLSQLS